MLLPLVFSQTTKADAIVEVLRRKSKEKQSQTVNILPFKPFMDKILSYGKGRNQADWGLLREMIMNREYLLTVILGALAGFGL